MQRRLGPLIASPQEAPHEGEQKAGTGAALPRWQALPGTALRVRKTEMHTVLPASVGFLHRLSLPCSPPNRATRWDGTEWSSGSQPTVLGISTSQMFQWDIFILKLFIIHLKSMYLGIWSGEFCLSLLVWGVCFFVSKSGSPPTSASPP